jgi:hypothetical protein
MQETPLTRCPESEMRERVSKCIEQFGWAPEHQVNCFFHSKDEDFESAFFMTPDGRGLLVHIYDTEWVLFSEPLAPEDERGRLVKALCREAFTHAGIGKVVVELVPQTRRALLEVLPPEFRSRSIAETMWWPVLDLAAYDPSFTGPEYKSLRNAKNRFFREHSVETKDAREVSKTDIHDIVKRWQKGRKASHNVMPAEYHALIDDDFRGADSTRVVFVDGKPEAFYAGWQIPRTRTYYLAISLHSYAHWGLGEVAMIDALDHLKTGGWEAVDLGGSDKKLFAFKEQFGKVSMYKTHYFSIVKS